MSEKSNVKKQAVALKYDHSIDDSPRVIGKGNGIIAEEIIAKAKENNIPIQEDHSLVSLLAQLEINQSIPNELYGVVAELFAFIYKIDRDG
ncbi:EscU/YscU/HrcU family type III secretion system export apparatus switch protein [Bacillus suaedae]|uniref:EscU/YscU/HrcU family type III secretion system export apparatus switch protein n=1 Tax=Halalkalibacter suaedae TaxID=2822140 RepID=A0A940WX39_9BACI|nr:EscU/YscU/HrcU family type III secretion system export apparatus switch protein [Bacillus suaedae]MBP3952053.1 EscU/YscU/HrcU family type III secretion system export apparatus switch protein [Bacillus suaedae]